MRWPFVLMLAARVAHADDGEPSHVTAGVGTAMTDGAAGWALRIVDRIDGKYSGDGDAHRIIGGIAGIDVWSAGDRWGFSVPCGAYVGAQVGSVRTTLGGGLGMYAVEQRDGDEKGAFGIAPFASATVEKITGDLVLVLEGTVARQIVAGDVDHNVYTVMLMGGRRFGK